MHGVWEIEKARTRVRTTELLMERDERQGCGQNLQHRAVIWCDLKVTQDTFTWLLLYHCTSRPRVIILNSSLTLIKSLCLFNAQSFIFILLVSYQYSEWWLNSLGLSGIWDGNPGHAYAAKIARLCSRPVLIWTTCILSYDVLRRSKIPRR